MTGDRPLFSVVSSRSEFEGKVASVRIDEVVMPSGDTAEREVVEHVRAVAIVVLDTARGDEEDPDLVLIEQYRHPLRRRLWELPAGLMDVDDESPLHCARRELAEETGLSALDWTLLLEIAPSPGFSEETIRIFVARGLSDVDRGEMAHEEADLKVVRVPLSQAVAAVMDGSIVNATAVAGILAATHVVEHSQLTRPAEDPWTDGNAIVYRGDGVPSAPVIPGAVASGNTT